MTEPLISICLPYYSTHLDLVRRCLESIRSQTLISEVIMTDDSPDMQVCEVLKDFKDLNIRYSHNSIRLGSPTNWNHALNLATGEYKMIFHTDDWFATPNALEKFLGGFEDGIDMVFGNVVVVLEDGRKSLISKRSPNLYRNPDRLIWSNTVGCPSGVMMRSEKYGHYNHDYTFLVDIEFYMRMIKSGIKYKHIPETLVYVGIHEKSLTTYYHKHPDKMLKEYKSILAQVDKIGIHLFDIYSRLGIIKAFKIFRFPVWFFLRVKNYIERKII